MTRNHLGRGTIVGLASLVVGCSGTVQEVPPTATDVTLVLGVPAECADSVEGIELEEQVDGTAPLPYINFEYRRMIGERWRVKAALGWLEVKIGDVKGGQYIGRLAGEYITGKRWGFGAAVNISEIDVDWENIHGALEHDTLTAKIDLDLNDISLYVRIRW